ncbi:MAG TPA: hypothetical protein VGJ60_12865 [Chloroflexota bacterium]|jgi:hypothetical protein
MRPAKRAQFRRAAVVLAVVAILGTAAMIFSGFIGTGPNWLVTVVGTLVGICAIGAVLCLFLVLFD